MLPKVSPFHVYHNLEKRVKIVSNNFPSATPAFKEETAVLLLTSSSVLVPFNAATFLTFSVYAALVPVPKMRPAWQLGWNKAPATKVPAVSLARATTSMLAVHCRCSVNKVCGFKPPISLFKSATIALPHCS